MKVALTLRWVARGLSLALAGLLILLAVGEGGPPLFARSVAALETWFLLLAVFSSLAAWRYELGGGIAGLAAVAAFYFTDFAASSFRHWPGGWVFPTLAVVPLLYLLAWWRGRAVGHRKT
jgi:hypothetical protein